MLQSLRACFVVILAFLTTGCQYEELPRIPDPRSEDLFRFEAGDPLPVRNFSNAFPNPMPPDRMAVLEGLFDELSWEGASFDRRDFSPRGWHGGQPFVPATCGQRDGGCRRRVPSTPQEQYFREILKRSFHSVELNLTPGVYAHAALVPSPFPEDDRDGVLAVDDRFLGFAEPENFSQVNRTAALMHEASHNFARLTDACNCDEATGFQAFTAYMLAHHWKARAQTANSQGDLDLRDRALVRCQEYFDSARVHEDTYCRPSATQGSAPWFACPIPDSTQHRVVVLLTNARTRAVVCDLNPEGFVTHTLTEAPSAATGSAPAPLQATPPSWTPGDLNALRQHQPELARWLSAPETPLSGEELRQLLRQLETPRSSSDREAGLALEGKAWRSFAARAETLLPAIEQVLDPNDLAAHPQESGEVRTRALLLLESVESPKADALLDRVIAQGPVAMRKSEFLARRLSKATKAQRRAFLDDPHARGNLLRSGDRILLNNLGERTIAVDLKVQRCQRAGDCSTVMPRLLTGLRSASAPESLVADSLFFLAARTRDEGLVRKVLAESGIADDEVVRLMKRHYGVSSEDLASWARKESAQSR